MHARGLGVGTIGLAVTFVAAFVGSPLSAPNAFPGRNGSIAFSSDRGDAPGIYVTGVERLRPVRVVAGQHFGPSWSPDGRALAFASIRPDGTQGLSIAVPRSARVRQLTSHPLPVFDGAASWSPDGKRLVFERTNQPARTSEIYVVNVTGRGLKKLAANAAGPAWSPDGDRIVFVRGPAGRSDVYQMDADGRRVRRLTSTPAPELMPDWSPDGRRILFVRVLDGNYDIYVMGANGSAMRRLTRGPGDDQSPRWSPDGRRIAFVSNPVGRQFERQFDIYVMNANGSRVRRLTSSQANELGPAWQRATRRGR